MCLHHHPGNCVYDVGWNFETYSVLIYKSSRMKSSWVRKWEALMAMGLEVDWSMGWFAAKMQPLEECQLTASQRNGWLSLCCGINPSPTSPTWDLEMIRHIPLLWQGIVPTCAYFAGKVSSAYIHIPFCRQKCRYCDFPIDVPGKSRVLANWGWSRLVRTAKGCCMEKWPARWLCF